MCVCRSIFKCDHLTCRQRLAKQCGRNLPKIQRDCKPTREDNWRTFNQLRLLHMATCLAGSELSIGIELLNHRLDLRAQIFHLK